MKIFLSEMHDLDLYLVKDAKSIELVISSMKLPSCVSRDSFLVGYLSCLSSIQKHVHDRIRWRIEHEKK